MAQEKTTEEVLEEFDAEQERIDSAEHEIDPSDTRTGEEVTRDLFAALGLTQ
jgi:hypothetical protein